MLDLLQYYFWVLCNEMKTRFRMVMIAHPGPGIGFHKQFMWQIIIPPTLFFANKGYHPSFVAEPNEQVSSPEAQCFISDLDNLHTELKRSITRAQERYQKYADKHHSPAPPLKIGDQVYVKAKYFCTTRPLKKLSKKNLGPYEVIS